MLQISPMDYEEIQEDFTNNYLKVKKDQIKSGLNDFNPFDTDSSDKPLKNTQIIDGLNEMVKLINEYGRSQGVSIEGLSKILQTKGLFDDGHANLYPSENKTNTCYKTAFFIGLEGGNLASGPGHLTHEQIIEKMVQHYHACQKTENFILISDHYDRDAIYKWSITIRHIAKMRSVSMALITGQNYSIIKWLPLDYLFYWLGRW